MVYTVDLESSENGPPTKSMHTFEEAVVLIGKLNTGVLKKNISFKQKS